jgi:surfactin synthase thioesterase subunit
MQIILPAVCSDYRAAATYRYDPDRKLDCLVAVLTGENDPRVSTDEARAWDKHTAGPVDLQVFPGGHFYLDEFPHRIGYTHVTALVVRRVPA